MWSVRSNVELVGGLVSFYVDENEKQTKNNKKYFMTCRVAAQLKILKKKFFKNKISQG